MEYKYLRGLPPPFIILNGTTDHTFVNSIHEIESWREDWFFCTPPLPPSDCTPTTSNDPDITADDVLIFPNPASLRFRIETKAHFDRLTMFNTIGIEVLQRNFTHELDVAHLAPGVYWIRLEAPNKTSSVIKKVVIQ